MQDLSMYAIKDSMADYTLTLGNLIDRGFNTDEKLHLSAQYYPIFDENYRAKLNGKIVAHYALREIGSETPQMFVFYLGRTMREQMDYFNQLYLSAGKHPSAPRSVPKSARNPNETSTKIENQKIY